MKRLGKMAVGLAGGLALNVGICAPNPAAAHNPSLSRTAAITNPSSSEPAAATAENSSSVAPYPAIAARNIFGLLAPAPPPGPEDTTKKDLPKIIPQGIMGVFGNYQVLFKVVPLKPDPKAKDEYYILSEGQMQEEIEVKIIDNPNSLVTFINHGVEQKLPLINKPSSDGVAPASRPPGGPTMPGLSGLLNAVRSEVSGDPGSVVNGGRGRFAVHSSGPAPGGPNSGMPAGFGGANVPPQQQDTLPPEAQVILMEGQRAQWQQANKPALNPLLIPPTPLTELNMTDGGGDVPEPSTP